MIKKDKALRAHLKEIRLAVGAARRAGCHDALMANLYPQLASFKRILSYSAKGSELDLSALNTQLCSEGRLLLPKVEGDLLKAYAIDDLEKDLQLNTHFGILEPIGVRDAISHRDIDCVLVPGLGFDERGNRIGYGLGHYDRFLAKVGAMSIGMAFNEQKLSSLIDIDAHDRAVDRVFYA